MTTPATWTRYAAAALARERREPAHEHEWVPWDEIFPGVRLLQTTDEALNMGCRFCWMPRP